MPTFLLIRHGENDFLKQGRLPGRLSGIHLNETGRGQAEALAAALKDLPITVIYSSPLERAVETAEPLAQAKELEIHIEPHLSDINVGEWEGRAWKTLRRMKAWQVIQNTPSQFCFPGGEGFAEAQARITSTLDRIAVTYKKEKWVAVVFHADPIKLAVAHYLGMPLDHFQRLIVDTGSVSVLAFGKSETRLVMLNSRPPFVLKR